MNLAYRDIKHNLLRFVLTNFGLSLLLGIVIVITGVYGGLIDDALRQDHIFRLRDGRLQTEAA
jgi:putative ABC transport system permease protein